MTDDICRKAKGVLVLDRLKGDFRVLAGIVGINYALQISTEFGGTSIYVPKLHTILRDERDAKIREAYNKGVPVTKLAMRHGLTKRRIYTILKREKH